MRVARGKKTLLYDSTDVRCPEEADLQRQEEDNVCSGPGVGAKEAWLITGTRFLSGGDKNVLT